MYMEEKDFISFLFRTLLLEEFRSKRAMARKLDMPLRTLMILTIDVFSAKIKVRCLQV